METVYLSGTKWTNSKDIEANILKIAGRLQSSLTYANVHDTWNKNKNINTIAVYSLGGAVADQLADELPHINQVRLYGPPTISRHNSYYAQPTY